MRPDPCLYVHDVSGLRFRFPMFLVFCGRHVGMPKPRRLMSRLDIRPKRHSGRIDSGPEELPTCLRANLLSMFRGSLMRRPVFILLKFQE